MTAVQVELSRLRAREPDALESVVRENASALLAGALAYGASRAEAEDLVQETFAAFLDGLDRFEGRSSLKTYLFGILYHKALTMREKRAREEASDDIEAAVDARFDRRGMWMTPPRGPDGEAVNDELREMLRRCSEGLSDVQRSAFFLREVEGEDPAAVCAALKLSAVNLRVVLHRARLRLRECLEVRWEGKTP
jgi:RNA polymerase sigma-70 factor (ECF subfamily)